MSTATAPSTPVERAAARRDRAPRWLVPAALAVPFLIAIAALRGLSVALPMFHGSDELTYHLPTIMRFAAQLPFPDLSAYHASQTPLFHVLMAYVGKLVGFELWRLRLVEALISYGLALAVFALLHRRLGLGRRVALALTLLFVLSPYVYASSFRLLTDNLALLFTVIAIERFERFRESDRLGPFLVGCLGVAGAILTRQSAAYLFGVAALYAMLGGSGRLAWSRRALALAAVGLAAVPAGALFLTWHGFTPPGGDPSTCGLCPRGLAGADASSGDLSLNAAALTLAVIGLYGGVLFAPLVLLRGRGAPWRGALRGPLAAAGACALLLAVFPANPGTHAGGVTHTAGAVWNVALRLPSVLGSSILFWALVPLGGAVLWARLRVAPRRWLVVVFLGCFLLGSLAIRLPWQKYVDPFALLALLLTVRGDEFRGPRELAGAALLVAGYLAYMLSFV
jgi:4-amino-4-deoxy-L-arabinose transferase-like glycosyltransferase